MKRRQFMGFLGGALAAWPTAVRALEPNRIYRLGQLAGGAAGSTYLEAFKDGMRDLGYIEGQNLIIEHRYADGKFERLPLLVRELLAWNPDVLLVSTTPANLAAKAATSTVPIVMVAVADPFGGGTHIKPRAAGRQCDRSDQYRRRARREEN
jgi:ABC-type uncharacterized transport system, periplasmic component